jgi:predicted permease
MREGHSRADADARARREFGDIADARDELAGIDRRAARRTGWREAAESFSQDVRISLRGLRARPGFTATVLLTLALGIGANAAIFSVMYAVLLKPLPFAHSEQLVHIWETLDGTIDKRSEASFPDYADLRSRTRALSDVAGFQSTGVLIGVERPTSSVAGLVTANFFSVLGVRPALGRTFLPREDAVGAPKVVVISDDMWQRQFGRAPNAIGATMLIDGIPMTVIGVLPRDFRFGGRAAGCELWVPLPHDETMRQRRGSHWLNLVGRLRAGVTVDDATRDLTSIMRDLAKMYPPTNIGRGASVIPLRDELVGSVRPLLLVLYGAVAVVLLVACANVANLTLMRGADRAREMAVRVALGAGRTRLVRQLLSESIVLALSGGALGLAFAYVGIRAIVGVIPPRTLTALPALATAGVDMRIVAYAALVSVGAGIAFGLVPALRASSASIHDLLKQGARGSAARGFLRDGLVVMEIALTVVLVSGAALFGRSLANLLSLELGIRPARVTTAGLLLSRSSAVDSVRFLQSFDRLMASARALPGVETVGLVSRLPLNGGETWDFGILGRPPAEPGKSPTGSIRWVGGNYFETLGIALKRGRLFAAGDDARAPHVVIISEALATQYFPGMNPLGQVILRYPDSLRIVGVVADVPIARLEDRSIATWYVPLAQVPPPGFMRIVVRGTRPSGDLIRELSTALAAIDPNAVLVDPVTMDDLLTRSPSVFTRRFPLLLGGMFAVTALVLALIGIYGVVSYSVGQRQRELGIRLALGADPRNVIALFLRHSARVAAAGTILGVSVALLATRFVSSMLYGIGSSDPVTYVAVSALLAAAALAATLVPAMRAARVDPTITLRVE